MDDNQTLRRKRLNEFKNTLNLSNINFAKALKTNPAFISQLLTGHRNVTAAFAYKIRNCYPNFNTDWLLLGQGEMFLDVENVKPLNSEAGLLTGVMEPQMEKYEKASRNGILEETLHRLAYLEDRQEALEEDIRILREQIRQMDSGME